MCLKVLIRLILALSFFVVMPPKWADALSESDEYKVKAGFIYNLLLYARFTKQLSDTKSLTLCLLGSRDRLGSFESLSNKSIEGRSLSILWLEDGLRSTRDCNVVFFMRDYRGNRAQDLKILRGTCVLTIADEEAALSDGVHIAFFFDKNKVHFAVAPKVAEEQGIKFSSRLLSLARIQE
jgi:hypothetical protein